ncbi:hypothetical protein GQX73_g3931 [Xylaria multiplex]|uniref:DUF7223 domain-containing protein n=1 Tax=Xylaria multiplex TaxID=323545 RepID=A0A7C8MZV0_9PEZI|nr:hypothetical protein GQX73_g3931 [Xylaria multiplex]
MRVQTGFLALFSVLRGATALYELPDVPLRRELRFTDLFEAVQSPVLRRSTHDATFSLDFEVTDEELTSGEFHGAELAVTCKECSTTGEVIASAMLPDISDIDITHPGDIFDTSMLGLTFNGVGATIKLDLSAEGSGDFSVPLLKSESPIGVSGPGFQIGVVFSVDLVLKVTGKIKTEGGFKVVIPDGSSFIIPFDESKPNIAKFNGASASLLPVKVSLPAGITAALRLKVQAGVMLPDLEFLDAKALAGASISIPEVHIKESASSSSKTCLVPVSADLNINAGVFVDIGASLGGEDIGDFNPKASTTLFAASTSTCLKSASSSSVRHSASKSPTRHHSASVTPGPSHASGRPGPTTLATSRKTASQGSPSGGGSGNNGDNGGFGAPSSFAVAARTYAKRSAYPITLQSLATPITNFAVATPTPAVPVRPVRF